MIFGNAEFMDMPFEPIIKAFRGSALSCTRSRLVDYADAFFEYLECHVSVDDETANSHVQRTFISAMSPLVRSAFEKLLKSKLKRNEQVADKMGALFVEEVRAKVTEVQTKPDCPTFDGITAEELSRTYADQVVAALTELTSDEPPSSEVQGAMNTVATEYIGLHLKKNVFSGQSTGIAFAGFDKQEQFPSLYVYDTEGLIMGRVKRGLIDSVPISPVGQRGHIAALAQDDVVKRYVEGIDPRLSRDIGTSLRKAMGGFGEALAEEWFKGKKRQPSEAACH